MRAECLRYLCDPNTRQPLELTQGVVRNPESGARYAIRDGIPIFLNDVVGSNRKYQAMYDRLAPGYDIAERLYKWIFRKPDHRLEYISELVIKPGARVLEVSVGTGANVPYFQKDVEFFGIDLSWGMLAKCKRNITSWHQDAQLFQGEAERLPFCDAVFR